MEATIAVSVKKVSLIIEGLATTNGGAERVFCQVANFLVAKGYSVDVVTHEIHDGRGPYFLSDKLNYVALRPTKSQRGWLRRSLFDPARYYLNRSLSFLKLHRLPGFGRLIWINAQGGFWRRLERYLEQSRPDVAIAFMPRAMVALAQVRTSYDLVKIASTHSTPQLNFDGKVGLLRRGELANPFIHKITNESLWSFDAITVLLPEFIEWYPQGLRDRLIVLPNPIQCDPLGSLPLRREKVLLGVGRLVPIKNFDILIDAWAQILPGFPDWRLEIFGEGPRRTDLQSQIDQLGIGKNTLLMGLSPRIFEDYRRAALLVHPARQEGFGLVIAEALNCGLPVIGFADCSGVNSLIIDGVNGSLAASGRNRQERVNSLATSMSELLGNTQKREFMGSMGPETVAEYSPDIVMAKWEDLILAYPS